MVYIELIIGCMTSGKTTELLQKINRRLTTKKNKVLYVRPEKDTRAELTHDLKTVDVEICVVDKLMKIREKVFDYDAVFIDEVQFLNDACEFVKYVEQYQKRLQYIAFSGLSGDSERKPWPVVTNLIPLVDNLLFLKALCVECENGQEAAFSKCCVEKKDKVLIGNSEVYRATCRHHFFF